MLLNSGSSNVFLVVCANVKEAMDKIRSDKRITPSMKLIFLMKFRIYRVVMCKCLDSIELMFRQDYRYSDKAL